MKDESGRASHLSRTAYLMKKDVALNPMDIRLFGSLAVMTRAKGNAHMIEEFGSGGDRLRPLRAAKVESVSQGLALTISV